MSGPDHSGPVDLHSHSTASDGSLCPAELAAAAAEAGLVGLALTDHDTVDGLAEFQAAGRALGLAALGGVEISLEHPSGSMHLLAYNLSGQETVPEALSRLKKFREERNRKMLERLAGLGCRLSWDRLKELSGGGQLGRPHFAALLVEDGYCRSREEAFERFLGRGRPGYVDKVRLSSREGLAMVRRAGWVPALAHPVSLNLDPAGLRAAVCALKDEGLAALEAVHPSHNPDQTLFLKKLARDLDLAVTAGSDFHGAAKPDISLEWVKSAGSPGWEMVERLRDRLPAPD